MSKRIRLTIEKFALGGFGLGHAEGKAVFVPYTAPGDDLDVSLVRSRKDMAFARAENFHSRGADVISPICPSFSAPVPCGGCDWLHLDYQRQLAAKTALVRELLQSLAPDAEIPHIIGSPNETHYRNKAFLPVGEDPNGLFCGIYSRWSHQIACHDRCYLHPPLFDTVASRTLEILTKTKATAYDERSHSGNLRHLGFRISRDGRRLQLILVTRSGKLPFTNLLVKQLTSEFPQISAIIQNINRERGNVILGPEEKILFGEPWLEDDLAGLRFRVHYRSFWQVNLPVAELIINRLRSLIPSGARIIDAFAGIGALGLSLASEAASILCIEDNPAAIADGEYNAGLNCLSQADFLCAKTEDALPALLSAPETQTHSRPEVLILDPPRGGVQPSALQAIIAARIPSLLYLSCSPMTLRRDLEALLGSGAYRLRLIQSFDMFPQTWHIENLAVLDLSP